MADLSFGIPLSDVVHDHERLFIEDYMRGYRAMNTDDKGKCIRKTEQMKVGFTAAKGQNYKFSFPRNKRLEERGIKYSRYSSRQNISNINEIVRNIKEALKDNQSLNEVLNSTNKTLSDLNLCS